MRLVAFWRVHSQRPPQEGPLRCPALTLEVGAVEIGPREHRVAEGRLFKVAPAPHRAKHRKVGALITMVEARATATRPQRQAQSRKESNEDTQYVSSLLSGTFHSDS